MDTAISLACKQGDGLSPDSPSAFVLYSIGRLRVRNKLTLRKQGSFSLGARALFSWSRAIPSNFIYFDI